MLGLYVHIPFCSAICNYCNFNRGLFDADAEGAVRRGAASRRSRGRAEAGYGQVGRRLAAAADTIYLRRRHAVAARARRDRAASSTPVATAFDVAADREVTLEANPETRRPRRGSRLPRGRRQPAQLRRPVVPRRRTAAAVAAARRRSRARGVRRGARRRVRQRQPRPDDVAARAAASSEWLESVDAAIALAPEHLSLYLLEVYPNAPLRDEMARARWSQAPDDDAAAMYLDGDGAARGGRATSSTRSRTSRGPGRQSRHNLKYWTDGEWLGFGCGAHSTRGGVRWKNVVVHRGLHRSRSARRADWRSTCAG